LYSGTTDSTSSGEIVNFSFSNTERWQDYHLRFLNTIEGGTNSGYLNLQEVHFYYSESSFLNASFEASPESGYPPLEVAFNDTSTAGTLPITSWLWDFNDYSQSNHPSNASHTFNLNGTYNVTMTVGDGVGSYTAFKNITVGEAPVAPGLWNVTIHVKDKNSVNLENASITLVTDEIVLEGKTNSVGIYQFIAVPGTAAALISVRKTGYPEYVETFTITSDLTKEIILGGMGIKLYVDVKDSIYGTFIDNVDVGIKNTTSGIWRNKSGSGGYLYYDSTGANYEYPLKIGQTVVVAASKAGYRPDSKTVTIPNNFYTVTLNLVNINGSAPSSGNFTAVIAVADMETGLMINGASVAINELGWIRATNGAGTALFYNVPVGSYSSLVSADGYQSVTSDISGSDQETSMKRVDLLKNGYHQDDDGNIIGPGGTPVVPGGGTIPGAGGNTTAAAANDKAANAITIFLDNAVSIGSFVFILLMIWFVKKIFWS
jgi:PKD repeat protein